MCHSSEKCQALLANLASRGYHEGNKNKAFGSAYFLVFVILLFLVVLHSLVMSACRVGGIMVDSNISRLTDNYYDMEID
jgi:hypothetical protein